MQHVDQGRCWFGQGEDFTIVTERKCTDILCCLIFILFWIGMLIVGIVAFARGEPDRLHNGYDFTGEVCGFGANSEKSNVCVPLPMHNHFLRHPTFWALDSLTFCLDRSARYYPYPYDDEGGSEPDLSWAACVTDCPQQTSVTPERPIPNLYAHTLFLRFSLRSRDLSTNTCSSPRLTNRPTQPACTQLVTPLHTHASLLPSLSLLPASNHHAPPLLLHFQPHPWICSKRLQSPQQTVLTNAIKRRCARRFVVNDTVHGSPGVEIVCGGMDDGSTDLVSDHCCAPASERDTRRRVLTRLLNTRRRVLTRGYAATSSSSPCSTASTTTKSEN